MIRDDVIDRTGPPFQSVRGQGGQRHLLREVPAGGRARQVAAGKREEEREEDDPGLFCGVCGHRIASEHDRIAVNGSHTHTFFNPAGLVFELGCFRRAPGCLVGSEASDRFTWFAGHSWRPAFCGRCAAHLGWRFDKEAPAFFSLILTNLRSR